MRILCLGIGMQGRAVVTDLAASPAVTRVVAADSARADLERFVASLGNPRVVAAALDVRQRDAVLREMRSVDAVVVLLPKRFEAALARLAIEAGIHYVNASYASPELVKLDAEARERGVALVPECGMDPGLDHVMAGMAADELDELRELYCYGGGLPEPAAADGPLRYKISWSFADVLRSYHRPARLVIDGESITVPAEEIFAAEHLRHVVIDGLGRLEGFPNADLVHLLETLGVSGTIRQAGRYSLRYPGHSALWKTWVDLGFLSEEPVRSGGGEISPRQFLVDLLEPQLHYRDGERDVVVLRIEALGSADGAERRVIYQLIDWRQGGLLAMQRTVGFTASIVAQMLTQGLITRRGLLSTARDLPLDAFLRELRRRGIAIERANQLPS